MKMTVIPGPFQLMKMVPDVFVGVYKQTQSSVTRIAGQAQNVEICIVALALMDSVIPCVCMHRVG